jgi:hypothetical protein
MRGRQRPIRLPENIREQPVVPDLLPMSVQIPRGSAEPEWVRLACRDIR